MISSGMRSIIVWFAVVMVDHLCFDPRRRASPGSEPPDGRPPGVVIDRGVSSKVGAQTRPLCPSPQASVGVLGAHRHVWGLRQHVPAARRSDRNPPPATWRCGRQLKSTRNLAELMRQESATD